MAISFFLSKCRNTICYNELQQLGFNYNSISPRVPEIKTFARQTDRQTDGEQSDLIKVAFFLKRYGTPKKVYFVS